MLSRVGNILLCSCADTSCCWGQTQGGPDTGAISPAPFDQFRPLARSVQEHSVLTRSVHQLGQAHMVNLTVAAQCLSAEGLLASA